MCSTIVFYSVFVEFSLFFFPLFTVLPLSLSVLSEFYSLYIYFFNHDIFYKNLDLYNDAEALNRFMIEVIRVYLEGQFGSYSVGDLVDDLGV